MLTAAALLGGCASASVEIGVTTRAETYEGFGDPMAMLTADPPACAVLPAVMVGGGGRGDAMNMALAHAIRKDSRSFASTLLSSARPETLTPIPFEETLNRSIRAGRTRELQRVLASLGGDGILDGTAARLIGDVLGVEYLLVPKLSRLAVDNAGRFTFTGLTFIRTGWTSIEATLQLWHAPSGELVWQSTGEGSLIAENVVGISPPAQAALDGLLGSLLDDLRTGRTESVMSRKVDSVPSASSTDAEATETEAGMTASPETDDATGPENGPAPETATP